MAGDRYAVTAYENRVHLGMSMDSNLLKLSLEFLQGVLLSDATTDFDSHRVHSVL